VGLEKTTNRIDAAMLNGIAGAWLDFDEGNFLANGHPGIQVIPAALAVAQERGLSGREFLTAVALSYEVVARIGMATKIKLIINPHGTFGVVGAALATARLMGVAASEYRNLASLAASSCVATNRHTMLDVQRCAIVIWGKWRCVWFSLASLAPATASTPPSAWCWVMGFKARWRFKTWANGGC
jgi:2-methylcitrate dehydratase PrpD